MNSANTNKLQVGNFNGGSGWDDVLISDSSVVDNEAIAILLGRGATTAQRVMYPRWIVHHPFNSNGWW